MEKNNIEHSCPKFEDKSFTYDAKFTDATLGKNNLGLTVFLSQNQTT